MSFSKYFENRSPSPSEKVATLAAAFLLEVDGRRQKVQGFRCK
jgi:hypothetical protein